MQPHHQQPETSREQPDRSFFGTQTVMQANTPRQFQLPLITLEILNRSIHLISWNAAPLHHHIHPTNEEIIGRGLQWHLKVYKKLCTFTLQCSNERPSHWINVVCDVVVCLLGGRAKGLVGPPKRRSAGHPSFVGGVSLHFTPLHATTRLCMANCICNCHKVTKWHFMIVINNEMMTVIKNK